MTDPDVQHAQYYQITPEGNHNNPSSETLRRFERLDMQIDKITEGVTNIQIHLTKQDDKLEVIHSELKGNIEIVDRHDAWINSHKDFIDTLEETKKDNSKRLWDYVWKIGVGVIIILLGANNLRTIIENLK
jgi:hypothetical protein